jgi:predicted dehydrogenase
MAGQHAGGSGRWAPGSVVNDGTPGSGLRVGIAGASHWHLQRHAANLKAAGASFAGVCDFDPRVAAQWASDLGCPAYPDPASLMDEARPDLVLALGRVSDMAAQARILLDRGVPLLAEKPLGLNATEVTPLADLAAAKGAWASVALVKRYDPLWDVLDRLREDGTLGEIAHAHLRLVNGAPQRYAAWGCAWMLDPATAGGGALMNLGIHGIDFVRHLAGSPVRVAGAAVTYRMHEQKIEDYGTAILRSESGIIGTVEAGYTYPDSAAGMTASGDNLAQVAAGGAYVTATGSSVALVTARGAEQLDAGAADTYRVWIFDSLARFREERPPVATIADCAAAVAAIDAAYASAKVR